MQTSFLRWAGSKKKLLPRLHPYWQASGCTRYVEPFAGSAMLYFAIKPRSAVLADTNKELIDMYHAVQRDWRVVYREISEFPCKEKFYYRLRDEDCTKRSVAYRAARFIYLNRFCFNGLYRTNSEGRFNVPFAKGTNRELPTEDEFRQFASDISRRKVQFRNQDFRATLQQAQAGDFVYADPPYAAENKRIFNQYGPATFGINDLRDLAAELEELDDRGVRFVVSYAYTKDAVEILGEWGCKSVNVQRTVASNVECRKSVRELFVSNIRI